MIWRDGQDLPISALGLGQLTSAVLADCHRERFVYRYHRPPERDTTITKSDSARIITAKCTPRHCPARTNCGEEGRVTRPGQSACGLAIESPDGRAVPTRDAAPA